MTVSFLRVRPVEAVNPIGAATRRREGTTALETESASAEFVETAAAAGLLVLSHSMDDDHAAGWVLPPVEAPGAELRMGWRVTITDAPDRDAVLEALARTGARFVRTGRSSVAELVERLDLPGIDAAVSVFVDSVEQAVDAVAAGARDLLLRDWDAERIGHLRDAIAPLALVERTVFGPVGVDECRATLAPEVFGAWLSQVDAVGRVRPRYQWAPGRAVPIPAPERRLSAQWPDTIWVSGAPVPELEGAGVLRPILEHALDGRPPDVSETAALFGAMGDEVDAVAWTADVLRRRSVGDRVTYVVNRNINYTNLCYFRCGFCAFSKGPKSLNLRGDPYLMGIEEIVGLAREAWMRGASEVTLQGGIHPDFTGDFYVAVVEAIKAEVPDMHIHGFTPLEVWQGAATLGVRVRDYLLRLRDAGLGTLPGTAAEILDDQVRRHLCPDKIRTAQWAEVMLIAHDLGLPSTATIMFGHIDGPCSWANHLEVVREIQRRSGGITEFVPLPFVHMGAPIYLRGRSRPGPTWDEVVLIHAVARIAFDGLIPNVQASWVKLGLEGGLRLLDAGCNDLGGTLMNEIITRSAGATHGQEVTAVDFERVIRDTGRVPARRTTLYEILERAR